MNPRDEKVAEFAGCQHGCFSDDQALAAGFTARTVRYRVASGGWCRLGPNSLRLAATPVTWLAQLKAGLLDLGPDAVVARAAAAQLLSLEGVARDRIEFALPRALRNRATAGIVHSTVELPSIDRAVVGGFPVTSATRTIIDLGGELSDVRLGDLVDSAVRRGSSSPLFLARRLNALRGPGRHSAPLVDRILVDSGGHSRLERTFLALVRRAGYDRPRTQVVYSPDGRFVARVDFDFDFDVVVEVMGRWIHELPGRLERDSQRHAELASIGKRVLPLTFRQVYERPDWVLAKLAGVLAHAA